MRFTTIRLMLASLFVCAITLLPALRAAAQTPAPNSPFDKLTLDIRTGNDDLRGGNDNLNVELLFRNGTSQLIANVNRGQRLPANTSQQFFILLNRPMPRADIVGIKLSTTFAVRLGSDVWEMAGVTVKVPWPGVTWVLATHGLKRFTALDKTLIIKLNAVPVQLVHKLELEIRTGADDLRGGNDNLNVDVIFSDGTIQRVANVNGSKPFAVNTTRSVIITLRQPMPLDKIKSVRLITTNSGGIGSDIWVMDSIRVRAVGLGGSTLLFTHGRTRFTASANQLIVP